MEQESLRTCTGCGDPKPLDDFSKCAKGAMGKMSRCKMCEKKRYEDNRATLKKAARDYYVANREKIRAAQNLKKATPEGRAAARDWQLKEKFGITHQQYELMLEAQHGLCAICAGPPNGRWSKFDVDHDHVTRKVRGLLCGTCNKAVGLLHDDPSIGQSLVAYLLRNQS